MILGVFALYATACGALLLRQADVMRRAELTASNVQAQAAQAAALAHQARHLLDPERDRQEAMSRFSTMLRSFRAEQFALSRLAVAGVDADGNGNPAATQAMHQVLTSAAAIATLAEAARVSLTDGPAAAAATRNPVAPDGSGAPARPVAGSSRAEAMALETAAHALASAHERRLRSERVVATRAAARLRHMAMAGLGGGAGLLVVLGWLGLSPLSRRMTRQVTALKSQLARERDEATCDAATGLPNLRGAREHLGLVMKARESRPAVLHIALDQAGFARGPMASERADPALRAAARRLRSMLRPGQQLARVGLGEFTVVLAHVEAPDQAEVEAQRLIDGMNETIVEDGDVLRLPIRAGVAVSRRADRDPEALLSDAELALGEAIRVGGRRCALYAPGIRMAQEARALTAVELAGALSRGEIIPYFQPQVHLSSGALIGFESLVRWRHPERGVLGPAEFVSIAEETGQIDRMGDVAMRASLAALAEWRNLGLGVHHVALNVSAQELRDPALADKLAWDVDAAGLSPRNVALEVLESVLVEDDEDPAIRTVAALAAAGFSVELDDFGTGHASIANLQKLQVHRIKIDRSFITGLDRRAESRKIVGGIVGLASSLAIQTLAEGVETMEEAATARDLGCELAQGYVVGRPMPKDAAERWIRAWNPEAFMASLQCGRATETIVPPSPGGAAARLRTG